MSEDKEIRLNQIERINELTDLKNKSNIANTIISDFLEATEYYGNIEITRDIIEKNFDRKLRAQVNNAIKLLIQNKILVENENNSLSLNNDYLFGELDIWGAKKWLK